MMRSTLSTPPVTGIKLAALIQARLSSERCPRKMLRPFAGTTLIDIALDKFAGKLSVPLYFAVHESELIKKYYDEVRASGGFWLRCRNQESAEADEISVVMNYLDRIDADFIMLINPCHVFLTLDTVEVAIKDFRRICATWTRLAPLSMTSVTMRHTWFYHIDGRSINLHDPTKMDTKVAQPVIEVAHAFHTFPRQRFMRDGCFWTNTHLDPAFHIIPDIEALDIDTELDFEIAEALWEARGGWKD